MSKFFVIIIATGMCFSACRKDHIAPIDACLMQTANPDHQSYSSSDFFTTTYIGKHCGLIPLSQKHYWVYLDSIFDNGNFVTTKLDTLRFVNTYQTKTDGLIWWEANKNVGLPLKIYANDSSIIGIDFRLFTSNTILDARKEVYQFSQDSLRYITSFGDEAAVGRALHLANYSTRGATFSNCLFFEKYARNYRRDQVYLEPGVGVVKYVHEEAPFGSFEIQTQQISTLVSFHFD